MNKLLNVIAIALLWISSACGLAERVEALTQDASEVRQEIDEVADELEATIAVVRPVHDKSRFAAGLICDQFGDDSRLCQRILKVQAAVNEALYKAESLINHYRDTGEGFDAAHAAVKDAVDKVAAFSLLVRSIWSEVA